VTVPTPPVADDDGSVSDELSRALVQLAAGEVGGEELLAALAAARLLVPVVAVLDEAEVGADGLRHEKQSSMATVLVESPTGGRALLAFSGIEPLTSWRAEARPVPLVAPLAARAAVGEGADTLLVDVAGPTPFAVTGDELLLVAAVSRAPGDPCEDPVLLGALRQLLRGEPRVRSADLLPGPPATLTIGLDGAEPDETGQSWVRELVERIAADRVVTRLLPEGVRVRAVPAAELVAPLGSAAGSRLFPVERRL
jgi:hypothetical protein